MKGPSASVKAQRVYGRSCRESCSRRAGSLAAVLQRLAALVQSCWGSLAVVSCTARE